MEIQYLLLKSYQAIVANEITLLFAIVLTAILGITSIIYISTDSQRAQSLFRATPPFLVSIGILGTFVGIFAGLLAFDVSDIDASIPPLLDGLKVAFITSILGMLYALIFRSMVLIAPTQTAQEETSAEDIYNMLSNIRSSISGDEETSMVSQLQRLRTSTTDLLSDLKKSFEDFANKMAENNTNALIEALERVMRDFNAKINEQFGDNFKRLNEAVEALLQWQDNYKEHVERLTEQFQNTLTGIEQAKESLITISTHMSPIPKTMDNLRTLIETMQRQTDDLDQHLEAFKSLRQQAGEAFPLIETRLVDLTDKFSNAVVNSTSKIEGVVTKQSADLTEMATTLRDAFEAAIRESNENLANQIKALDDSMQEEVKRVVEVMGSHLASLSAKFVEDYAPLTDKLREVVNIAQSRPRGN